MIYKRTKNLRTVQSLLGHSKLESTVRYLAIEVDDALEISEQTEIWPGIGRPSSLRSAGGRLRVGYGNRQPAGSRQALSRRSADVRM